LTSINQKLSHDVKIQNESKSQQNSLLESEKSHISQELSAVKQEKENIITQYNALLNEWNREKEEKQQVITEHTSLKQTLSIELNREREAKFKLEKLFKEQAEEMTQELEKIQGELNQEQLERKRILSELNSRQNLSMELMRQSEEKERRISELEATLKDRKLSSPLQNNYQLIQQIQEKDSQIAELSSLIEPLRKELREIRERENLADSAQWIKLQTELEREKKEKELIIQEKEKVISDLKQVLDDNEEEVYKLTLEKQQEKKSTKRKKRDTDSVEESIKAKKTNRLRDPEKMTIKEIKSALTHAGKDYVLPTDKRPKSDYVKLYNKYLKE